MNAAITSAGAGLPNTAFEGVTQTLENRSSPLDRAAAHSDPRKAAKDFEAFFISQMLSDMFSGIEADPLFGGGAGENVFRSLMIDEYGKSLAETGGVGISESVLGEIIRLQEINANER